MGYDEFANGDGNGHAAVDRGVSTQVTRSRGSLRIDVRAEFEECIGMPGYGSVRHSMAATVRLGREYSGADRAGAVHEMMLKLADSMRSTVERRNDAVFEGAVTRAIGFDRRKRELEGAAQQERMAEGARRDTERRETEDRQRRETGRRDPEPDRRPARSEYDGRRDSQPDADDDRGDDRDRCRRDADRRDAPRGQRDERRGGWGGQRNSSSSGGGGNQRNWRQDGGRPRRVSQLYGYVKDHTAWKWFTDWAQREEVTAREFRDWPADAMNDAIDDYEKAGKPLDR